jgi:hypothetical protein
MEWIQQWTITSDERHRQRDRSGWLDSQGEENGDKCAWITSGQPGAAENVMLGTGSFPVQSLWSNAFNNNAGGCVLSHP